MQTKKLRIKHEIRYFRKPHLYKNMAIYPLCSRKNLGYFLRIYNNAIIYTYDGAVSGFLRYVCGKGMVLHIVNQAVILLIYFISIRIAQTQMQPLTAAL